jgi:hypothetical protein
LRSRKAPDGVSEAPAAAATRQGSVAKCVVLDGCLRALGLGPPKRRDFTDHKQTGDRRQRVQQVAGVLSALAPAEIIWPVTVARVAFLSCIRFLWTAPMLL